MNGAITDDEARIRRHLGRMRLLFAVGLAAVPVAVAAALWLGPREPGGATPFIVTMVAYVATLWIGLTAARDARRRLDGAKRGFAVHGDLDRLLVDHLVVYLTVLLRLEAATLCGFVASVWGLGPVAAAPVLALAALLVGQTWPTRRKSELLVARARDLRDG